MNEPTKPNSSSPPEAEPRLLDAAGEIDLSSILGTEADPQAEERAAALRRLRTLGYL